LSPLATAAASVAGMGSATIDRHLPQRIVTQAGGPPARYARAEKPHHRPFFFAYCGPVFHLSGGVAGRFTLLPAELRPTKHDPKT